MKKKPLIALAIVALILSVAGRSIWNIVRPLAQLV